MDKLPIFSSHPDFLSNRDRFPITTIRPSTWFFPERRIFTGHLAALREYPEILLNLRLAAKNFNPKYLTKAPLLALYKPKITTSDAELGGFVLSCGLGF